MNTAIANTDIETEAWSGGSRPLRAHYGKMMMWFFILSDALTFSAFLVAYGFSRFKFIDAWPIADNVFTHVPFLHGQEHPMIYVAFMTFVLIMSSVTMVLAVDAGHHLNKKKVAIYLFLTIFGGLVFLGSQAWEWSKFISGEYGAVQTKGGNILQFVNAEGHQVALKDFVVADHERIQHRRDNGLWFVSEGAIPTYTIEEVIRGLESRKDIVIRTQKATETGKKVILSREASLREIKQYGKTVVEGANLHANEYGAPLFADFFFFITGFHGFHVFSGIVINIIIFCNVVLGTYEKRKHYEMVEKVGLYWHFVDLVWVFVFTFFYLV